MVWAKYSLFKYLDLMGQGCSVDIFCRQRPEPGPS